MAAPPNSPPISATSTPPSHSALELDLSSLPALSTPSPPSNTLIITNLYETQIFTTPNLTTFRNLIASHLPSLVKHNHNSDHPSQENSEPPSINSFSPLKSLSRIIISFTNTEAAIAVNQLLSGTPILDCMPKIYFGEPTPLYSELHDEQRRFLKKPDTGKLFFISPPPSPPCGWESKQEDAPNKEVWARDLEAALRGVSSTDASGSVVDGLKNVSGGITEAALKERQRQKANGRGRSGSLIVYDPQAHGDSADLPAVMVEDTSEEPSPVTGGPILAHTARPPVELMDDA